jgi:hypothetical protein
LEQYFGVLQIPNNLRQFTKQCVSHGLYAFWQFLVCTYPPSLRFLTGLAPSSEHGFPQ